MRVAHTRGRGGDTWTGTPLQKRAYLMSELKGPFQAWEGLPNPERGFPGVRRLLPWLDVKILGVKRHSYA